VGTKTDLADQDQTASFEEMATEMFPPKSKASGAFFPRIQSTMNERVDLPCYQDVLPNQSECRGARNVTGAS